MEEQLLTVRVGSYLFGAPVSSVTEILADTGVTPIPRTPSIVAGVSVVRGQPLMILSIRPLLSLPQAPVTMALRWGGRRSTYLIAVDRVEGLYAPDQPLPPDSWMGLVPEGVTSWVQDGFRWRGEWLWAWTSDLPDRLMAGLQQPMAPAGREEVGASDAIQ